MYEAVAAAATAGDGAAITFISAYNNFTTAAAATGDGLVAVAADVPRR